MSYLRSLEYTESKEQLQGEYKGTFQDIESYYIQIYTDQSYEVQLTLSQILGDFLMAQERGKPLVRITGPDIRKYAIMMLEAEFSTVKGKFYWLSTAVILIWCALLLLFFRVVTYDGFKSLSFLEKMNHIYLSIYLTIILSLSFALEHIRTRLNKALFYRPKIIRQLRLFMSIPVSILMLIYFQHMDVESSGFVIRIPALLFLILFLTTTVYIIVAACISYRKTKAKKQELEAAIDIHLEQVTCPSCGKEHDLDYPKCPYCGYRVK